MKDPLSHIFLALAGIDASRNDLKEFLRWIDLHGIEQTAEIIRALKVSADSAAHEYGRGLFLTPTYKAERNISEKQIIARIEKLMLDSGLTKVATVQATKDLLKERGYSINSLPESTKISLRVWITRLLRQVSPEDLLNVASLIRAQSVHGIDWPLRREKL